MGPTYGQFGQCGAHSADSWAGVKLSARPLSRLRPSGGSRLRSRLGACLNILLIICGLAAFPAAALARPLLIVALGDSLTAGLGLPAEESFPEVLQKALRAKGYDVEVANAGVSGDTAADGLARFDWAVPDGADAAIVELGANDMLRGLDPAAAEKSLGEILGKLKARHVATLIAGMRAAPNLGADYRARFDPIYADLARKYDAGLYPFFLDGVAADPKLNQKDGLHPTKAGVDVIVERILPAVEALIAQAKR
jgi:acyl-CoA thioesterase I